MRKVPSAKGGRPQMQPFGGAEVKTCAMGSIGTFRSSASSLLRASCLGLIGTAGTGPVIPVVWGAWLAGIALSQSLGPD